MANIELAGLEEKRRKHLQSKKENNDKSEVTLSDMYSKETHFIYELIQNAEDEKATIIEFKLEEDRLIFQHNSEDKFSIKDIESITGIGSSTKKGDENTIGKFGVGFKSVFMITDRPEIYSGKFNFAIEDFIVPVEVAKEQNNGKTKFIFPFKAEIKEQIYNKIEEELNKISITTILFLKNIREITCEINGIDKVFQKDISPFKDSYGNLVSFDSLEDRETYLKFDKEIQFEDNKQILSIAFRFEDNKIVECANTELFVFLQTEKKTDLKFFIHAPFLTTPARDNIKENTKNDQILDELLEFVAELIPELIRIELWNEYTIDIFPVNQRYLVDELYKKFYVRIKSEFSSKEIIPTSDSKFTFARNVIIGSKELVGLLNESQIYDLFQRSKWCNINLTFDTRILLKSIEIPEVTPQNFAEKISANFLGKQSDGWIIKFYKFLLDKENLWRNAGRNYFNEYIKPGLLRSKEIIRTNTGKHIKPFINEIPQVWLSKVENDDKGVKLSICKDNHALDFLKKLGLSYPDNYAKIVNEVLPKYSSQNSLDKSTYLEDFDFVFSNWNEMELSKRNDLIQKIKSAYFILCSDGQFHKPLDPYQITKELKVYFEATDNILFVSDEYYEKCAGNIERLNVMFNALQIPNEPKRISIDRDVYSWKKYVNKNLDITTLESLVDYSLDGLNNIFDTISVEKSTVVWGYLMKLQNVHRFFNGEFNYFRRIVKTEYFDAEFYKQLKNEEWLYTKDGRHCKPSDIRIDELHDDYKINVSDRNTNNLADKLGLRKQTREEQLEEERNKFKREAELERLEKEEYKQKYEELLKSSTKKQAEDNLLADEQNLLTVEELVAKPFKTAIYIKTELFENSNDDTEIRNRMSFTKNKRDRSNLENEGKAAEIIVQKRLREVYQGDKYEVLLMNDEQQQIGFDIQVKNRDEGDVVKYIEVKSTKSKYRDTITLSKAQFEMAKNNPDKFEIYCVMNIQDTPTIVKIEDVYSGLINNKLIVSKVELLVGY